MRVLRDLKHFKLVSIQVDVELVASEILFLNKFDGAWHARSEVLSRDDHTEGTGAKSLSQLVLLIEVCYYSFEAHFVLKCDEVVVSLLDRGS